MFFFWDFGGSQGTKVTYMDSILTLDRTGEFPTHTGNEEDV